MAAQGIRTRHSRSCRSRDGARCNCSPSFEAFVFLKRENRKIRKTFPTQAAAKSWRSDALRAAGRGQLRAPTALTIRQAGDELIAGMRDGSIASRSGEPYKPASIRSYAEALRLRIFPAFGDVKLAALERADVQALADRLASEGLSASTVNNQLDPLRVVFRRAIKRDLVTVDPTAGLELRRPKGRRDRIADPKEAARLLEALPMPERALWATAIYAGLRLGELRALRWSDVNLGARLIHVARGWDAKEGEQAVKSKAGDRRVPIPDRLATLLIEQKLASGRGGEALVFGVSASVPFDPSVANRRALKAWGWVQVYNDDPEGPRRVYVKGSDDALDRLGLHEARHSYASMLIASKADAKTVQTLMGHASITVTYDQYGGLFEGHEEAARHRLDAFLDGPQEHPPVHASRATGAHTGAHAV